MRYSIGFMFVLAGLVALPLNVSAQAESEDSLSSWQVEAKPTPEEPALQLKLDDTGVGVVPSPWRTPDGYTLEEMELRVKRAKIGLGVSGGVLGAGMVLLVAGLSGCTEIVGGTCADWADPVGFAGAGIALAGGIAIYAALGIWVHRKRKLRRLEQAHYGAPRRVQWDPAQSRLVF
jgi:hypothetical protein